MAVHRPPRLSFLLCLLLTTTAKSNEYTPDKQAKIAEALKYYSANIDSVTTDSYAKAEVGADGSTKLEFASRAVEEELKRLQLLAKEKTGGGEKADDEESAEDDDGSEDGSEDDYEEEEEEEPHHEEEQADSQYGNADIIEERHLKDSLDTEEWYRFSYWELHAFFSCAKEFTKVKQIPSTERWRDLRDFYHEFVKQDLEDWPIKEGEEPRVYQWSEESYDPPMVPFQSGYKGRGLKAARDIKEGEMVFRATNNTIIFNHGHTWRKFLFALYERHGEEEHQLDGDTTCDVLVWSWVQQLVPHGPLVIVMDMDNGSLMNEGREESGWEHPNIKCGKGDWCDFEYYAMNDIKEGEEILCDYREFAMLDAWRDMGL